MPDPGGAAFYGPKISVQVKDALGRTWQMSTIQLDFNLPERFELEYTASDGSRQRPVMIHRALFGSVERFFAVLTEHYGGAFPAWLAPVQVLAVPVAEPFEPATSTTSWRQLRAQGIRAEVDRSTTGSARRSATRSTQKIPFVLIAGGEDAEAGAVSFRYRDGRQDNGVPVAEAIERIVVGGARPRAGLNGLTESASTRPQSADAPRDRVVAGRVSASVDPAPDGLHRQDARARAGTAARSAASRR